jgi:hypothetical protein
MGKVNYPPMRQDSMDGETCIRGEPAASVEVLLSPAGRGKNLLGKRRVPKEQVLAEVRARAREIRPEVPDVLVNSGNPLEEAVAGRKGPLTVYVEDPDCLRGEDAFIDALDDSIIVLCCQELCHQVSAVFRMH